MPQKAYSIKSHLLMFVLIGSTFGLCAHAQAAADSVLEKFVIVGNHQLFIRTKGPSRAPFTVVFESGGGGTSNDWNKVIALLPPGVKMIAYDRAGLGKSGRGPVPRTMAQEVLELHVLLDKEGVKGKIILIGQSIGGLNARLYAAQYPRQVAGLVLVDPTDESAVLGSMRYGGWTRLREKAAGSPVPAPQLKDSVSPGYDSTADYMAEEFRQIYLYRQRHTQALGNRPLVVIGAGIRSQPPGTPDAQWKQLREERDAQVKELTSLSAGARFILATHSTHQVQNDEPAVVAQAIEAVLEAVRRHQPLTP